MNFFQKTAAAATVVAATAGFAGVAEARCVTGVGELFNTANIADLTEQAHRSRRAPGNWDPDNRWPFGSNGPLPQVRVGRFDFSSAVHYCERQHLRAQHENPGQRVTTGLTCNGRDTYVITNNQRGLVCAR